MQFCMLALMPFGISPGIGAMIGLGFAISVAETSVPSYHALGGFALVEILYLFF
jgi:hypothetical protein